MIANTETRSINLSIIILAVCFGLLASVLAYFKTMEQWRYVLEEHLLDKPSSQEIALIAIDESSLHELGRWPWPRNLHANLIDLLTETKVKAIGMDILFLEPDLKNPNGDRKLAWAIQKNGRVALPALLEESASKKLEVTPPINLFSQAARIISASKISFDSRGIVNGMQSQVYSDNTIYPSLALAMLSAGQNQPDFADWDRIPSFIPYSETLDDYQYFSYNDVLNNAEIRQRLKDKYILIAATATGLSQRFATPSTHHKKLMSGADLTIKVLTTLLSQKVTGTLKPSLSILFNFTFVLIPIFIYGWVSTRLSLAVLMASIGTSLMTCQILLKHYQLWFNPLESILMLIISYSAWSYYRQDQIAQALSSEKDKTQATLHSIGDSVISTDANDRISFMNPAAELITSKSSDEMIGKSIDQVLRPRHPEDLQPILEALKQKKEIQISTPCYIINEKNNEYAVRFSVNPIRHKNVVNGMVIAMTDVSEIIDISQKMTHLATHDALTGLANRILLREKITAAIKQMPFFAILFIDLDGFKKINDGLGHAVGDRLLIEISRRLLNCNDPGDTVARWGGDEFVILLRKLDDEKQIKSIAERIIKTVGKAVIIDQQELFVTPSIGISCFPKDGHQVDNLLDHADAAMYKVKEMGRNNYCFYDYELSDGASQLLNLDQQMHHALKENQFEMFYQLQVDLQTGKIVGVEALIRWRHPEKGLLSPDEFIPLAEQVGLINPIGSWIIKEVCQQIKQWQSIGIPGFYAAINLSARQFLQNDLLHQIRKNIELHQLESHCIHIEVTESLIIAHINQVEHILDELKKLGIIIVIDDFGTGYASLSFLKRFAIDILKIDRSFIHNIFDEADDNSIVSAMISLAHSMNMKLIAEGVETIDQHTLLTKLGCHIGQGYYYSRPLHASAMTQLLTQSQGTFLHSKEQPAADLKP